MNVIECEARDIEVGDELVNMGEVLDVSGSGELYRIEWRGPFRRLLGIHARRSRVLSDTETVYRFPRDGE